MSTSATMAVARPEESGPGRVALIEGLVLARIAAAPADAAAITRDTWKIGGAAMSADRWSAEIDAVLEIAAADGDIEQHDDRRCHATAAGRERVRQFLGQKSADVLEKGWSAVRDGSLLLRALGLEQAPAKRQRALAKADDLRLAIVISAYGLRLKGAPTPARARQALALLALERAFGGSIKGALGAKTDLSSKASRLLAGQLSRTPKDFGTDARLVAALAAEVTGASKGDLASLRVGAIRRFIAGDAPAAKSPKRQSRRSAPLPSSEPEPNARGDLPSAQQTVAAVPGASSPVVVPLPVPPRRPDPASFAAAVNRAAGERGEGWAGNRKAYVSEVWTIIRERHPEWQISEIEFKSMLTEAHRTGLVVLANADLKDKRHMAEIQASAIPYKNTVWHYIRVEG